MMASDPELMGERVNGRATIVLGVLIAVLVTAAGAGYAVVAFVNALSSAGH